MDAPPTSLVEHPTTNSSPASGLAFSRISLAAEYKGERVAMREARKHAAWYMRGLRGAAGLRARAGTLETFDDLRRLCEAVMQENARQEAP